MVLNYNNKAEVQVQDIVIRQFVQIYDKRIILLSLPEVVPWILYLRNIGYFKAEKRLYLVSKTLSGKSDKGQL